MSDDDCWSGQCPTCQQPDLSKMELHYEVLKKLLAEARECIWCVDEPMGWSGGADVKAAPVKRCECDECVVARKVNVALGKPENHV